jgi:hypothetical protein
MQHLARPDDIGRGQPVGGGERREPNAMPPRDSEQRIAPLHDDGDRLAPLRREGRRRLTATGRKQPERSGKGHAPQRSHQGGGQARGRERLHPESQLL